VGCLSEVEIDVPENVSDNIAIVGQLYNSSVVVRVTGLTSYVGFSQPILIDDASVQLFDESGSFINVPNSGQGVYQTQNISLPIFPGNRYQLKVSINGKTYESTLETLFSVPEATSVEHNDIFRSELNDFGNIVENRYIQFLINTPLSTVGSVEKSYLKWDFDAVYRFIETTPAIPFPPTPKTCYYPQILGIDEIAIFNGPESRLTTLENEFLIEEPLDHRFSRGFYFNVSQQSLSEGAYNYWEQVQAITDLSGNFFEDPPGKIIGNFKNPDDPAEEVFGYFYATQAIVTRVFVKSSDYQISSICPAVAPFGDTSIRRTCFNCLSHPNSSLNKPSYWVE